jgi:hypothetical protein
MKYREALKIVHAFMEGWDNSFPLVRGRTGRIPISYDPAYRVFVDTINQIHNNPMFYANHPLAIGEIVKYDNALEVQTLLLQFFPIDDLPEQVEPELCKGDLE